jgi:hypothetical protein
LPKWEPNWLPTATATQPHLATPGLVIPDQMAYPTSSAITRPPGWNCLTVKWRDMFEVPDAAELDGGELPGPPSGWSGWPEWAADRWPSLADG